MHLPNPSFTDKMRLEVNFTTGLNTVLLLLDRLPKQS